MEIGITTTSKENHHNETRQIDAEAATKAANDKDGVRTAETRGAPRVTNHTTIETSNAENHDTHHTNLIDTTTNTATVNATGKEAASETETVEIEQDATEEGVTTNNQP
jgi:hypothetical protein